MYKLLPYYNLNSGHDPCKRKSAVELLQESKAFYVKSETVLDRKQELKNSGHLQVSQVTATTAAPRLLRKCAPPAPLVVSGIPSLQQQQQQQTPEQHHTPPCCWAAACHENERHEGVLSPQRGQQLPSAQLPPKSPRLVPVPQRRNAVSQTSLHLAAAGASDRPGSNTTSSGAAGNSGSEQLQTKLRRLLNTSDSKENVFFPEHQTITPPPPPDYGAAIVQQPNGGVVQQQQQQHHRQESWGSSLRYSPGSLSPSYGDDERLYCALPEVRFKFGRSNSHSHGARTPKQTLLQEVRPGVHNHEAEEEPEEELVDGAVGRRTSTGGSTSVVCHKSLPDLHSSTSRRRASLSPRSRHRVSPGGAAPPSTVCSNSSSACNNVLTAPTSTCPDCETSSDYSEEHSFRRDSVRYRGSSRHGVRKSPGGGSGGGGDASSVLSSGGRTHKSSGSSRLSHGATARDSGGSSGHCTHRSEPPPRVQDCWSYARRDSGASTQHSTDRDRSRKSSYNGGGGTTLLPAIARHCSPDSDSSDGRTDECSPTYNNSRFSEHWKEGRGRPILRSKSDISDRYWRHETTTLVRNSSTKSGYGGYGSGRAVPRSITELEGFFDCLGLDPDDYQRISQPDSRASSPVFFDSVSSVDSTHGIYNSWTNHQAAAAEHHWRSVCAGAPGQAANLQPIVASADDCPPPQRTGDQPSIVERNARIIKWLCQCRKQQFGYS